MSAARLLYSVEQVRAFDRHAIEVLHIPGYTLMKRAGEAALRALRSRWPRATQIAVVCGGGNNGGDGYVLARFGRAAGLQVIVLAAVPVAQLRGDARQAADDFLSSGGHVEPFSAAGLLQGEVIVDALLGTGASGEPRGEIAAAIAAIEASPAPVLAADVPSGVDASSGVVAGAAVHAVATATFHAAKPGLWIEPGRGYAGAVHVVAIGIPDGAPVTANVGLIRDALLDELPRRSAGSTKFTSGTVLVAGGSPGLTGAPCMAALAAQRAGAGYVTVAVPASLSLVFETRLLEAMTLALPDEHGAPTSAAAGVLLEAVAHRPGGVLVLGPGVGRSSEAIAYVQQLVAGCDRPLVLDADGLHAYAGALAALGDAHRGAVVITPHEGELGRLLGISSEEVAFDRLRCAREAARQAHAVVVLKGDDTLVADPDGCVAVSSGATPGLATAGTGDVLAGVVGALLAARLEPFEAAAAAVRLHALAGRRAAALHGRDGMIASDVIEALSEVRSR